MRIDTKKTITNIVITIITIYPSFGLIGWLMQPHVDTYIEDRATEVIWGGIANSLGKQDNGDPHTIESAQQEIIWQIKNGHTRDVLFKSMNDSLKPYEKYLRFAHKATPQGVLRINGLYYWFTGERDEVGEPVKYKVRKRIGYTGRWYLDNNDQWNLLWDNGYKPQQ